MCDPIFNSKQWALLMAKSEICDDEILGAAFLKLQLHNTSGLKHLKVLVVRLRRVRFMSTCFSYSQNVNPGCVSWAMSAHRETAGAGLRQHRAVCLPRTTSQGWPTCRDCLRFILHFALAQEEMSTWRSQSLCEDEYRAGSSRSSTDLYGVTMFSPG